MYKQFMTDTKLLSIAITATILLSACATSRPVIYPNEHVQEVGDEQVRKDINDVYATCQTKWRKIQWRR